MTRRLDHVSKYRAPGYIMKTTAAQRPPPHRYLQPDRARPSLSRPAGVERAEIKSD